MTTVFKGELKFNSPINIERSITPNLERLSNDTESVITVNIDENGKGSFEWEVDELEISEGGGLWFEGNELTDYDGVFSLPEQLVIYLEENGYNMDYAK